MTDIDQNALAAAASENRVIVTEYPYTPRRRNYEETSGGRKIIEIIDRYRRESVDWLSAILKFKPSLSTIAKGPTENVRAPYWVNGWLPGLDAMFLYTLVRENNPSLYLEVGKHSVSAA